MKSKDNLRRFMKEKLAELSDSERQKISKRIHQELFKLESWKSSKKIGIYLSFKSEWDTREIINKAWDEGKKVMVPKTLPKSKGMDFYQINNYNDLERGHFGIQEPIISETICTNKKEIDLLIVPGLVFSQKGYRIGFGGGYYDRYLEDFKSETLSLAWSEQILEKIPVNSYDIAVDKLLTEQGIYNI